MNYPGVSKEKTGRRSLTRDELELWHQVTRSVARLARSPAATSPERMPPACRKVGRVSESAAAQPGRWQHPPEPARLASLNQAPAKVSSVLAPFDRRLLKQLARGRASVDDVIDLHGLCQHEAHLALRRFLAAAQERAAKVVLIVTGKGSGATASRSRPERTGGVLYRAVLQWLSSPEFRAIIVSFEEAGSVHGGAGALYVRLRRANRPATPKSPSGR